MKWESDGWKSKLVIYMSSPIILNGHGYAHLKNGRMACVDLMNGDLMWISRARFGKYCSMILALTNDGQLLLMHERPDRFELIESRTISTTEIRGYLAMAGKEIYIRERNTLAVYRWE